MTEIIITCASNCFNCGHPEAKVFSTANIGVFHDGDAVECCNCGHKDEMSANGEDKDIYWYEDEDPFPRSAVKSLKEVS
ncbi:hypothetical protein IL972_13015 [Acinetobacter sp. FL51]|uniref:hypothetical protein n=1 Tax=Acinetobacter sp. FL51 TaxID=2777978 RepID=UPI0018E0FB94|nr:hypothetical protein [Acinetobacter sp. FL51]MBI1452833.1 hypothetical protein [Acinetobacter sp. FL51]